MTTHFKVTLFMVCLLVFASSCKKNSEPPIPILTTPIAPPVTTPTVIPSITTTPTPENVFVVGLESNGIGPLQAKLWNNGRIITLSNPSAPANANSVFVSGTDVYASGSENNNAVYWKNGVLKVLASSPNKKGTVPLAVGTGNSVFVSNNDVYVAGYEQKYNSFFAPQVAILWKNDKAIILGDSSVANSEARSVYVSGSDVYVSGTIGSKAVLWVNGVAKVLYDGQNSAITTSVFKSGNDVYVLGWEVLYGTADQNTGRSKSIIKLWKNGVASNITDGSTEAYSGSVFVSGTDVYVVGRETGASGISQAKLWKNSVPTNLTDGTKEGYAASVYVSGTDVYVGGSEAVAKGYSTITKYWKNGVAFNIGLSSTATSGACIFIK
jgi:hypothetical protein